ncbi:MAG: META domain-containing protein [bacterium]|nr:META domain-containing protein [bacterium]
MMRITILAVAALFVIGACKSKSDQQQIAERSPQPLAITQPDSVVPAAPDTVKDVTTTATPSKESEPQPATSTAEPETPKQDTPKDTTKAPPAPEQQLRNRRWKLVEFRGEAVVVTEDFAREPYITLGLHNNKLTGSGGCNRFGCKYTLAGNKITLDQFAATKKACSGVMDLERKFLADLETVSSYDVQGDTMWLLKSGKRVMKFTAVYL